MDSTIRIYETMANMCKVNGDEEFQAVTVMLTKNTFFYLSSHVRHCASYREAINSFRQ